jgi:DNA-binding NarL/FixJ family response regulator
VNANHQFGLSGKYGLKREHTDTPVLVLSIYPEEQFAVRALKSGASGYMTKESAPEDLVEAVRRVKDGGLYVSPRLAEKLVGSLNRLSEGPIHERLSDREFQVLQMIASGKTVSVIAEELTLSVKTVSTYRARVLAKMLMKNNSELTRYAFENGLVS